MADSPGTYRVRQTDDGWRVSGVDKSGVRVRKTFSGGLAESDARTFASETFEGRAPVAVTLDEWGLPIDAMKMPVEAAASINAAIGIGSPMAPPPPKVETPEEKKKKTAQAMMLTEMVGIGWAAGTVMMGRKITENAGKVPVEPNSKQVNNLADSAKETLQGWFGDREIKPWQLTILLTLAIPMTMLVQSKPKKLEAGSGDPEAKLRSVP